MTSIVVFACVLAGCNFNSAIERLAEARQLSADLLVQFIKAADAGNRAVMAVTDEMSTSFAREAEQTTEAVQKDMDTLAPLLESLGYSKESGLLDEFRGHFAEYQKLDRTILELAVENTNLKAQQLSFGSARQAADTFRDALESLVPLDAGKEIWHLRALVATAVASLREIQIIQAPHIADPDDGAMTRMEQQMAASERRVRSALQELGPLVQPASRARLSNAAAAFDRFMGLNADIVALSRRNTNVRSLALSLNEKGKLTATCETSLRGLQQALGQRGFVGTR